MGIQGSFPSMVSLGCERHLGPRLFFSGGVNGHGYHLALYPGRTRAQAPPYRLPRVRDTIQRWELPGLPRHTAKYILEYLQFACRSAPPRVSMSYFGMVWNGWCTSRRFHRQGKCVLCNIEDAWGSIEHNASCEISALLAFKIFVVPPPEQAT